MGLYGKINAIIIDIEAHDKAYPDDGFKHKPNILMLRSIVDDVVMQFHAVGQQHQREAAERRLASIQYYGNGSNGRA
jgi:hypothetical protein